MRTATVRIDRADLDRGPGAHDVHAARWDGAAPGSDAVTVVCVHGLGGSHVNWQLLAPLIAGLSGIAQVWAPDLAGFGLTGLAGPDGGERGARLDDQVDLLRGLVRTVSPDAPVVLVGNSMGGLLSILLASRRPELVAGLTLINPALPAPLGARLDPQVVANFAAFALPRLGERVLAQRQNRLTPRRQVEQTMALCAAQPDALDREALDAHVEMAAQRRALPYAHRAFLEAARDIVRTVSVGRGRVWDAVARISAPGLYVQGALDRLIRQEAGALLMKHRPDWDHVRYEDLGHVPMVEAPERVAADIERWLRRRLPRALAS